MENYLHPDYDQDEMSMTELSTESKLFEKLISQEIADIKALAFDDSKQWLGTLLIKGKVWQVQLVLTSTDLIDEG